MRRVHAVLQAVLKQAVKERLIPYNPCENCCIPARGKKEVTILPPEKIGRCLQEAEKYGVLPIFYLELSSGRQSGRCVEDQPEAAEKCRHRGACTLQQPQTHIRNHGYLQQSGCEDRVRYAGALLGRADDTFSGVILGNNSAYDQIPKDARGHFILQDGTVFRGYLFDEGRL